MGAGGESRQGNGGQPLKDMKVLIEQKGQPKSLNRRRTLVEWSSISHF